MLNLVRSPLVRVPDSLARQGVSLRPEQDGDLDFLRALYRSTREAELAQVDWSDAQKDSFVQMQFNAQRQHYRGTLENVGYDLILQNGAPIGRLYSQERVTQLHIVDIALIPGQRGHGLGGKLLEALGYNAAQVGKGLGIFVEHQNPARHLYDRLGFEVIADAGIYIEMERPAAMGLANGPIS